MRGLATGTSVPAIGVSTIAGATAGVVVSRQPAPPQPTQERPPTTPNNNRPTTNQQNSGTAQNNTPPRCPQMAEAGDRCGDYVFIGGEWFNPSTVEWEMSIGIVPFINPSKAVLKQLIVLLGVTLLGLFVIGNADVITRDASNAFNWNQATTTQFDRLLRGAMASAIGDVADFPRDRPSGEIPDVTPDDMINSGAVWWGLDQIGTLVNSNTQANSRDRRLEDDVFVVRGGTCIAERFTNGSGVITRPDGTLDEVSVNSVPGLTVAKLSVGIPNSQIGFTTVGEIRALGGNVIPSPNDRNPLHATLFGITALQAERLFTPTIPNPSRLR